MSTQTTNIGLIKDDETEFYNVGRVNTNLDIIDGEFKNVNDKINTKVDQVLGKGLSTNDYTTEEKQKLAGLSNYDDTTTQQRLGDLETDVSDVNGEVAAHLADNANPHAVTKAQVGLGSVDNIKQATKAEFESHLADYEYQTPTIVGTQIRLTKQSSTNILKFRLDNDLFGGDITISIDGGATYKLLKDVNDKNINFLKKGFVEVVADATFFTLRPRGESFEITKIWIQTAEPTPAEGLLKDHIWIKPSRVISDTILTNDETSEVLEVGKAHILYSNPETSGTELSGGRFKLVKPEPTKPKLVTGEINVHGDPSVAKVWDGSSFIYEEAYIYDGTQWVKFSNANYDLFAVKQHQTNTFTKYDANGGLINNYSIITTSYMPSGSYKAIGHDPSGDYYIGRGSGYAALTKLDSNLNLISEVTNIASSSSVISSYVDSNYVYLGYLFTNASGTDYSILHLFDKNTLSSIKSSGFTPFPVRFIPDDKGNIYCVNTTSSNGGLYHIYYDSALNTLSTVKTGTHDIPANDCLLSPNQQYIYVCSHMSIKKIRTSDFVTVTTTNFTSGARKIAQDKNYIYVLFENSTTGNGYHVIDNQTLNVINTIYPSQIKNLSTNRVYSIDMTPDGVLSVGMNNNDNGKIYRFVASTGQHLYTITPSRTESVLAMVSHPDVGIFPNLW